MIQAGKMGVLMLHVKGSSLKHLMPIQASKSQLSYILTRRPPTKAIEIRLESLADFGMTF